LATSNTAPKKPSLLVISNVLPYPGTAGQQQRVRYKLEALRERFEITFLTVSAPDQVPDIKSRLEEMGVSILVLPSRYERGIISKFFYRASGSIYCLWTGLKFSNYIIGEVEYTPARVVDLTAGKKFDGVIYEYWHAHRSASVFRERATPSVLDMHDVLWRAYQQQLDSRPYLPGFWKRRSLEKYRRREEAAWGEFDGIIAINSEELEYVSTKAPSGVRLFHTPMGTDLKSWRYSWQPAAPPRLVYYGGLGSQRNQHSALVCHSKVMPLIWEAFPDAELWLVGSNPPGEFHSLARSDRRVKVTGFVEHVQEVLNTMTLALCPWTGTFGFRSRLVELMALGVPVVASPQAVSGMEMDEGKGIFLRESPGEMAETALNLLADREYSRTQSRYAREQVERKFSFEATYGKLSVILYTWLSRHGNYP